MDTNYCREIKKLFIDESETNLYITIGMNIAQLIIFKLQTLDVHKTTTLSKTKRETWETQNTRTY